MNIADYPIESIHLPPNRTAIRIAQFISVTGGIVTIIASQLILYALLFDIPALHTLFGSQTINLPLAFLLLINGMAIIFHNSMKVLYLITLGLINVTLGILTIVTYWSPDAGIFLQFSAMNVEAGFIFLLLGNSLMIRVSYMRHRFHYSQLFLFIALLFALFGFLTSIYHYISFNHYVSDENTYLATTLLFLILCQSFLLVKVNRGFLGLFMTDTTSSLLARLSLLYFVISPFLMGVIFLLEERIGFATSSARLSLFIVSQIMLSFVIIWITAKVLYPREVQNFLTREALRVNNITLELDSKDLSSKMNELEKNNEAISEKLNNQKSLIDYIGQLD